MVRSLSRHWASPTYSPDGLLQRAGGVSFQKEYRQPPKLFWQRYFQASEPAIEEIYKEWNKVNREKLSLYYKNKDPTVPLADNKEFRSIKNMIIKAVSEMAKTAELVATVQQKDKTGSETMQVQFHISEETASSEPPASADPPPVVIHYEESVPKDITVTAKEILGALARLIGDKCMAHRQGLQGQIDQKLQSKINEKKLAMGLKTESTQKASYQTEETYEMSM